MNARRVHRKRQKADTQDGQSKRAVWRANTCVQGSATLHTQGSLKTRPGYGGGVAPARSEGTLSAPQVSEHRRHAEGQLLVHSSRRRKDAARPKAYPRKVGAVLRYPSQSKI